MYTLDLTESETDAIAFIGHRYCWAYALRGMEVGKNLLHEHEAWEINEAFEVDTKGGHSFFPMLDHNSELARKLFEFMERIV